MVVIRNEQEGTHRVLSNAYDWFRHLVNVNEARTNLSNATKRMSMNGGSSMQNGLSLLTL